MNQHDVSLNFQKQVAALQSDTLVEIGRAFVEAGRWELPAFPAWPVGKDIDWLADPFKNRTWKWHLHQWGFVPALIAYDRRMQTSAGVTIAVHQARLWWQRFADRDGAPEMAWHDHGTALRARNILLLVAQLREHRAWYAAGEVDVEFLLGIAQAHAELLLREDFYSAATNHGLDQSLVLFELSQELPRFDSDGSAGDCACQRITFEINHAFATDGGHVENSPAYQNYGLVQEQLALQRISAYDKATSVLGLSDELRNKAALALAHMVRPNGTLPPIGDTALVKVSDIFSIRKPTSYPAFQYAIRAGRMGTPPASTDLVLPESGWAFLRSDWKGGADFARATQIAFKSGFLSQYHRHDDDLSFTLFAFGEEWIADGGLWKHQPTDPMRIYLRSAAAHSLSAPTMMGASRNLDLVGKSSRITCHETDGVCSTITGESGMFPGFHARRRLTYNRTHGAIEIEDSIEPVRENALTAVGSCLREGWEPFVTRFLVPGDKKVAISPQTGEATITTRNRALTITMTTPPARMRLTKGKTTPRPHGWRSTEAGKIEPAWTIEFFHLTSFLEATYALEWS